MYIYNIYYTYSSKMHILWIRSWESVPTALQENWHLGPFDHFVIGIDSMFFFHNFQIH